MAHNDTYAKTVKNASNSTIPYNAWRPGVKEQIEKQSFLNSSGVRDFSRNLGIAKGTVTFPSSKKNAGGSESVLPVR